MESKSEIGKSHIDKHCIFIWEYFVESKFPIDNKTNIVYLYAFLCTFVKPTCNTHSIRTKEYFVKSKFALVK